MARSDCPICANTNCECNRELQVEHYNCPRCGIFDLVGTARGILPELLLRKSIDRSVLSHLIRKAQNSPRQLQIYEVDLPSYQNAPAVAKPREQADNLILCVGGNQISPDAYAKFQIPALAATIGAAISGPGEAAFFWIIDHLKEENFVEEHAVPEPGSVAIKLKMRGWDRYDELQHSKAASRVAFMAMKFRDETMDRVLYECFKPAVAHAGFELRALNEAQPAGLIDNQIRAAIRRARFVVADLTHDNNGAYFEAGFAEGIGLPVVYTCEREKFEARKTHFDTNHMVTIPWEINSLQDASNNLTATIRATLPTEADRRS